MNAYLVTGPPCAGKTTWCRDRATADDVIVDFDSLADALCPSGESRQHTGHIRAITARVRLAAIEAAWTARCPGDLFIIFADPPASVLAEYLRRGAHHVELDPGRDVVLKRCRSERPQSICDLAAAWYAARERS